jgi:hypothetical protein
VELAVNGLNEADLARQGVEGADTATAEPRVRSAIS